jgi:hypothetical protein
MKLYAVTVTLRSDPWLATEFKSVLAKLPEFDEIAAEKALVLAHNIASAKSQVHREIVKAIAKNQLMDNETLKQINMALDHKDSIVAELIPMSMPRVMFIHDGISSIPVAA